MIKQIGEYFGSDAQHATLHQATVSLQEMGPRTISTQIRIDGDYVPSFDGWYVTFKGEKFVLPTKEPQAAKDNTTRNSLVDLSFESWVYHELKRYFFFEPVSINAGTAIADKYKASVSLNVEDFAVLFNKVLQYYFGNKIVFSLYLSGQGQYSTEPKLIEADYTYIWDVLSKFYETFGVRWEISYNSTTDVYTIQAGYPASAISDHDFEYGYSGGLLRFERQVQDQDIHNILLGRGGEKNLPYRYFKRVDSQNPEWAADPDAIPELANIYFDRLRDVNFRWYVRGWMQNSHRDTSWEQQGYVYPTYSIQSSSPYYWAYQRGRTDETFNPVEYVKDDASIASYGERWGALDDNDDIYPTIQGRTVGGLGRIDETVAVSEIVTDDIQAMAKSAAVEKSINPMILSLYGNTGTTFEILSETFTIPEGSTGNVTYVPLEKETVYAGYVHFDTTNSTIVAVNQSNNNEVPISGIPAGTYRLKLNMVISRVSPVTAASGTFGIENVVLTTSEIDADAWKPTFDIWVKNIWDTEKNQGETDAQYAERVWGPILGDRVGNEAKVVFSDGFMSVSQDYEFTIASYPVRDTSRTIQSSDGNTYQSEWRITLRKSDAEFDATGLYIPNASSSGQPIAGDHFFFIGIDMPFLYVRLAEEDLNSSKEAQLDTESAINPTWVINLDKVRCNTLEAGEYGQTLADRLAAGATVRITDPRFTNGQVLTLYVQSITYTWNEPSDESPYIVPDIEVVLSDKVVSSESALQKVQNDVRSIESTYVRASDVQAAVRSVAEPLFLKKTGESDTSSSPTQFASKVTSRGFRQGGIGGTGWGFYRDNTEETAVGNEDAEGDSVLEVDRVIVRKEMHVNNLVINQIAYVGGKEIISAAKIEVTKVIEDSSGYRCYFDQRQNSVVNLFVVNDIAYGQVFNPDNTDQRYYKMRVSEVGLDYIKLAKSGRDGAGAPAVGDVIVQYGNTTQAARQYVIVRDVIGGGYERMLSGLNSTTASGTEYHYAGYQSATGPRWFVGASAGEYAEWVNGVLNIKGRITVRKSNGTYVAMDQYIADNDLQYIKEATNQGTLVDGGLVLTSLIQLGMQSGSSYNVLSGINGVANSQLADPTQSIAAWFGGPMVDHEKSPSAASYAKSLFRMDGSGYLAGGNIHWDSSGYGGIPGISWSRENGQDVVTIGASVRLASTSGDTVTDLLNAVNSIKDWFEEVNLGTAAQPAWALRLKKRDGSLSRAFITYGDQIVLGSTSGGGGGGGTASAMSDLNDVVANLNPSVGDVLVWTANVLRVDGSTGYGWKNTPSVASVAGRTGAVTLTTSDITNIESWISGKGYITSYTDTKNTAGSTSKTGTKMYLVAAQTQAANPQTYSNGSCYIGTDNCLYSGGAKVITAHQSVTDLIGSSAIGSTVKPIYYTGSGFAAITASKGSATKPVYFDNGEIKEGTALGTMAYETAANYVLKAGDTMTGDLIIEKAGGGNLIIRGNQANGSGGALYFFGRYYSGAQRNGIKIASEYPGSGGYDIQDLVFYSSSNLSGSAAPIWSESMRIKYDGTIWFSNSLYLSNAKYIYAKDSGGTARSLLRLNSNNEVSIAYGTAAQNYNTYLHGGTIYFGAGTSHTYVAYVTTDGMTIASGKTLKIGDATISWVPGSNNTGYLHIDKALVTAGDQIVISGTPGGGGGGGTGISFLYESYDFSNEILSKPSETNALMFYNSELIDKNGNYGAWQYILPSDSESTVSGESYYFLGYAGNTMKWYLMPSGFLPLTAGTSNPLTGTLLVSTASVYGIYVNNTSTGASSAGIRFQVNGTTQGGIYVGTDHDLHFNDGSANRQVYHSGNFSPGNYVAKVGDTMTGALGINRTANSSYPLDRTKADLIIENDTAAGTGQIRGGNIIISRGYSGTANQSAGAITFYGRRLSGGYRNGARIAAEPGSDGTGYDRQDLVFYSSNNTSDAASSFVEAMRIKANTGVTIQLAESIAFANACAMKVFDTNSVARNVIYLSSSNNFIIGYGTAGAGYSTYLYGNLISFRYGTSYTVGMILNSSGNVTIGSSDLASTSNKLYVDGAFKATGSIVFSGLDQGTSDVVDGTEILTSYASANGFSDSNAPGKVYRRDASKLYNYIRGKADLRYLALAGGTMTGDIVMTDGEYINASNGYAMLGLDTSGNFYCGSGYNVSSTFFIRSGNINLTHRKFTSSSAKTDYIIWDASNSNLQTVDWSAKKLTVADILSAKGGITLPNNIAVNVEDTASTPVAYSAMYMSTSNNLVIGYGTAGASGGNTNIYGKTVSFRYGTGSTRTIGLYMDATGKVGIGSSTTLAEAFNVTGNVAASGSGSFSKISITSTTGVAHIAFSRGNYNYITTPTSGSLAFVMGGNSVGAAGSTAIITATDIRPGANSTYNLGYVDSGSASNNRLWANIFGEAIELVKASTGPTITMRATGANKNGGTIQFRSSSDISNGFKVVSEATTDAGATSSYSRQALCFYTSNVSSGSAPYTPVWKRIMRLSYTGKVFIGDSNNSYTTNLEVNGTITSSGDQVVNSDAALKTNLKNLRYTTTDIAGCRAVTFDWKDGSGHSAGSIAQDWKRLIPELVHGEEGHLSLAYGQIALINTVIEAREIEKLKMRINELEREIKRLRS